MKNKIPIYLRNILKLYPKISSGRKNYDDAEKRIEKSINLTKDYKKNKKIRYNLSIPFLF